MSLYVFLVVCLVLAGVGVTWSSLSSISPSSGVGVGVFGWLILALIFKAWGFSLLGVFFVGTPIDVV